MNFEKLKELKEECPGIEIDSLDVTKGDNIEKMLRVKYSDTNVLFNCAGYALHIVLIPNMHDQDVKL